MKLNFKLLEGGILPTRAHKADAGFDLYSPEDFIVKNEDSHTIPLKVCVEIPVGYVGFIMGRSSLNRGGINALTGVIDSGYTGEISVILHNTTRKQPGIYNGTPFFKGDRIAQLVICKLADIEDAAAVDKLNETERGDGGFGSTGA